MRARLLFIVLFTCLLSAGAAAQSFSDLVTQLGVREIASAYLQPAAEAIGASFNSGLYHTAKVEPGFHLYVGLKGVWTFVPPAQRSFEADLPASLVSLGYPARVTSATAFGDSGAVLHSTMKDPQGNPYPDIPLPKGTGTDRLFVVLPQVTVGSIAATEVMLRFIPPMTMTPEIGRIRFFGIGLKHSPTQYLESPIDIAFMGAYQEFGVGDVLTVKNYNVNVHASVAITFVTLYAGAAYEGYDIDASYNYTPTAAGLPPELRTPQNFSFSFTGRNTRFTLGATARLLPLIDLNVDYSFGKMNNLTIGAGIAL